MRIRVPAALAAVATAVILASCTSGTDTAVVPTETADPTVTTSAMAEPPTSATTPTGAVGQPTSVFDLEPGMCSTLAMLEAVSSPEAGVRDFPTIDCAAPHDLEVYASHTLTDDTFPGDEAVRTTAEEQCLAAFEPYVGRAHATSLLETTWLAPSEQTWDQLDDRDIFCILQAGEETPGSFAGSGM